MKFIIMIIFLFGCGTEPSKRPREPRNPGGVTPPPSGGDEDWDDIKPLVQEQCALSGCHAGAGFLATGRAMKASSSANLIARDKMPKPQSPNYDFYNAKKKQRLLNYLNN